MEKYQNEHIQSQEIYIYTHNVIIKSSRAWSKCWKEQYIIHIICNNSSSDFDDNQQA